MSKDLKTEQVIAVNDLAGVKVDGNISKIADALNNITSLTPNIFYTDIINTINDAGSDFDVFIKRDINYGNGVRYVSVGYIESKEGIGGETPDGQESQYVKDYEDYSTSNYESRFPLKWTPEQLTKVFKDVNNWTTFLNQIRATNEISLRNERKNAFLYLFGKTNVKLPQYIKTELDKTISKIKNVRALGEQADMKAVFTEILHLSSQMGGKNIENSNDFNIGFAKGETTNAKYNSSIASEDLVLIIPKADMINLSQEAATIYHQEFYQGANKFYKVIEADIPSGTAWLIDKETIRFDTRLREVIAMRWMNMNVTMTTHFWNYAGVFKYGNGIKITYSFPSAIKASAEIKE